MRIMYSILTISLFMGLSSCLAENKSASESQEASLKIGVKTECDNPKEDLKKVADLGFSYCQVSMETYTSELANEFKEAVKEYDITPTALICMGPEPYVWDFMDGPSTIGIVPREYRTDRIKRLYEGIDFCEESGIPAILAHFGFIPENPRDSLYVEFVHIMKEIGQYALERGIDIYFETGQETPITLIRTIEDIGTGNLYINCDLANLVMYGKSHPLDGIKLMRNYIKEVHAKDGIYPDPSTPFILGKEKPIPEGNVDFPAVVNFLKDTSFEGVLIIEYELAENNYEYILKTKEYLQNLIDESTPKSRTDISVDNISV